MFTQILQLQNVLTKDIFLVYPSTESVDSSYGLECWIDKDNNSFGQCQFGLPFGFIKKNLFTPISLYIQTKGKENEKINIYLDSNTLLIDSHLKIYGTLETGVNECYEIIGAVYQDENEKTYDCFGTDIKTIIEYLECQLDYYNVLEENRYI